MQKNEGSLVGNPRFFGAALMTCGILLGAGCHAGVDTPAAPSAIDAAEPSASSVVAVPPGETLMAQGGPLSFAMDAVPDSGYSGTCTLGEGGAGFRIKASGQGTPGTTIRFQLRETATTLGPVDIVDVDQRGNFRSGQERITYYPSGTEVQCVLLPYPGPGILAQSAPFLIP